MRFLVFLYCLELRSLVIHRRGTFRLLVKRTFVCWLRVVGIVPSQGRKALNQSLKFPPLATHCPTAPQTTSWSIVFITDRRNGREGNFVACEVRHLCQATAPKLTDYYTVSGLDRGP